MRASAILRRCSRSTIGRSSSRTMRPRRRRRLSPPAAPPSDSVYDLLAAYGGSARLKGSLTLLSGLATGGLISAPPALRIDGNVSNASGVSISIASRVARPLIIAPRYGGGWAIAAVASAMAAEIAMPSGGTCDESARTVHRLWWHRGSAVDERNSSSSLARVHSTQWRCTTRRMRAVGR